MKTAFLAFVSLLAAFSASAEQIFPGNVSTFGTFNYRDDSARLRSTTNSRGIPVSLSTKTFRWSNGPAEEPDYLNHTFGLSYNSHFDGHKVVPGEANFSLSFEPKYRNHARGQPGPYQTEFYFAWQSPDGSTSIRPWGMNVQHDTGAVAYGFQGDIRFFRNVANGRGMWGIWHDDGLLDLTPAPSPAIKFPNNVRALYWANAAGTNSLAPLYVDNQNRTVIGMGGGGSDTLVESNWMDVNNMTLGGSIAARGKVATRMQMSGDYIWLFGDNHYVAEFSKYQVSLYKPVVVDNSVSATSFKVGGNQVVGPGCGAISNADGTDAGNARAINAVLACMRAHGLVSH